MGMNHEVGGDDRGRVPYSAVMEHAPPATRVRIGSALSGHLDPVRAAEQVCERCIEALGGAAADLAVLFLSAQHLDEAGTIAAVVQRRLGAGVLIGASGESVVGGEVELEDAAGVSLLAASLPGVELRPFRLEDLPQIREGGEEEVAAMGAAAGMTDDAGGYRGTILLADPFSVAMNVVLPALSKARPRPPAGSDWPRAPLVGGMASASNRPLGNALLLGDEVLHRGAVGVSLHGAVRMDSLVSQGCRPFGPTFVVTAARNQLVQRLGGRPALRALHEAIESLDEDSKQLLKRGIFLGRVVNEYKERFGRGDFLIRSVVGVDQESGAIAVADMLRVGQTVQFHMRDAATADEDLGLLLDMQKLYDPPAGVLLFTCNGRGSRLFETPHHDAAAIVRAFTPDLAAEEKAKGGKPLGPVKRAPVASGSGGGQVPLAGFFAAGEIGPIGDEVFLHGHTASVAFFHDAAV